MATGREISPSYGFGFEIQDVVILDGEDYVAVTMNRRHLIYRIKIASLTGLPATPVLTFTDGTLDTDPPIYYQDEASSYALDQIMSFPVPELIGLDEFVLVLSGVTTADVTFTITGMDQGKG